MANFAARLSDIGKSFSEVKILGKFAGAVVLMWLHILKLIGLRWQKNLLDPWVCSLIPTLLR